MHRHRKPGVQTLRQQQLFHGLQRGRLQRFERLHTWDVLCLHERGVCSLSGGPLLREYLLKATVRRRAVLHRRFDRAVCVWLGHFLRCWFVSTKNLQHVWPWDGVVGHVLDFG